MYAVKDADLESWPIVDVRIEKVYLLEAETRRCAAGSPSVTRFRQAVKWTRRSKTALPTVKGNECVSTPTVIYHAASSCLAKVLAMHVVPSNSN